MGATEAIGGPSGEWDILPGKDVGSSNEGPCWPHGPPHSALSMPSPLCPGNKHIGSGIVTYYRVALWKHLRSLGSGAGGRSTPVVEVLNATFATSVPAVRAQGHL